MLSLHVRMPWTEHQTLGCLASGAQPASPGPSVSRSFIATFSRGLANVPTSTAELEPAPSAKTAPGSVLTGRQLEIARLIAEDLTNRQIADRLFLSERTVETHITNMLNKLGLNSRIQLSRWLAAGA